MYKIETERTDLFDVNILIAMRIRLEGHASFSDLSAAFSRACSLHEVLNLKVVLEPSGSAYYAPCDVCGSSFCETDLSFTELIASNEKLRFHIEDGEFIRGFWSPDGLVFLMHHLGGDGKSLLYFIETFTRCLAGEECDHVPFRTLGLSDLPGRMPGSYGLLARYWNRKWSKERKVFTFSDLDEAYASFWKNRSTVVDIKSYQREELSALISESKAVGVSLTSYLITDMVKDMDGTADVGIAVDGRLDGNRSMGNQATGISVKYKYDQMRSFADNARHVDYLLKRKLSDENLRYSVLHFMGRLDPTLVDALNMARCGYYKSRFSSRVAGLMGYSEKTKDLSITNLTRVDIPLEYGPYAISDIVFVPPIVSYGKNIIGIVTAGDTMNVVRHVYES